MMDLHAALADISAGAPLPESALERFRLVEALCEGTEDRGELVSRLLADPGIPPWKLSDLLTTALESGLQSTTLALLEAGVDVRPLRRAAALGLADVVAWLLTHGARLNRRFDNERTPLHEAAAAGHAAVCRLLVEAGADLTIVDPSGKTAAELANDEELSAFLRDAVGKHGPQWFRDAQAAGRGHYVLYNTPDEALGFNPNDVQFPVLTGNDADGFGWGNTVEQGIDAIRGSREMRWELDWLTPILERIRDGEPVSLDAIEEHRDRFVETHDRQRQKPAPAFDPFSGDFWK